MTHLSVPFFGHPHISYQNVTGYHMAGPLPYETTTEINLDLDPRLSFKVIPQTGADILAKFHKDHSVTSPMKPLGMKPDDTKPDDTKPDDTKPDDKKPHHMKTHDKKAHHSKSHDAKPHETKTHDAKPNYTKPQKTKSHKLHHIDSHEVKHQDHSGTKTPQLAKSVSRAATPVKSTHLSHPASPAISKDNVRQKSDLLSA